MYFPTFNILKYKIQNLGLFVSIIFIVFTASAQAQPSNSVLIKCMDGVNCIEQGWSDKQRSWWYRTSQGSRLLPLKWFIALETVDGDGTKFLGKKHIIEKLNYLENAKSIENPYGLPVGFVIDEDKSNDSNIMCDTFPVACKIGLMQEEWVGLNCSACHTNEITYKGERFRVEGAPTLADFQGMEESLLAALKATRSDEEKFNRFAARILGRNSGFLKRKRLMAAVEEQIVWQELLDRRNRSERVRYGHGRLDAQGHILTKVLSTTLIDPQEKLFQADAPASYPHIWNTSQQKFIQWNGIVSNTTSIPFFDKKTDVGALIRNTSEVIGVFAHVDTADRPAWRGYNSSIRVANLVGMERQLALLKSPRWPESILGKLNTNMVTAGLKHFTDLGCVNCHKHLDWDDIKSPANEQMIPIFPIKVGERPLGTDISLVCNTLLQKSLTGNFEGQRVLVFGGAEKIGKFDYTRNMLVNASIGSIWGQFGEFVGAILSKTSPPPQIGTGAPEPGITYLPGVEDKSLKRRARNCLLTPPNDLLRYKTRPLNGIWATAPYLHNGSVPSLYDLLLPSKLRISSKYPLSNSQDGHYRPESFFMGTREFDPVNVGFKTGKAESGNVFELNVIDPQTGNPIYGNYNSGHDYGADKMNHQMRMELVEYLKSL